MIQNCDFIDYNVRPPGGGLQGLNELDVVGLDFTNKIAYLCEVTTHIRGLSYGGNEKTVETIRKKHEYQKKYAEKYLTDFHQKQFMFWSPYVPVGYITDELSEVESLEMIINQRYSKCIDLLKEKAKDMTHDVGNPFFRTLQILECLRR